MAQAYSAEEIHMQLARGTIALAALAELEGHVARFDREKADADKFYQGRLSDATSALAYHIAGSIRRATAALETVGKDDDDDDMDDD